MNNYNFESKLLQPTEINVVLYHSNCIDGFTSAFCCWYFISINNLFKNNVRFIPVSYLDKPPDLRNKNVLICDFSFKNIIIKQLINDTKKLLILDHHKSALIELKDIDDKYKVFDMNHCGAFITWKYFFPNSSVPKFIEYVEDNDLWLKKLPNTEEFTYFIKTIDYKFEEYKKFLDNEYIESTVFPYGKGMVIQNNNYINTISKKAINYFMEINNKYYFVSHVNSDILKNEIGNNLLKKFPNINFSAIYTHNTLENNTGFSLRSDLDRTDVSKIAEYFLGGGHRNAAGCGLSLITNHLPCKILDINNLYFQMKNVYTKTINKKLFVLLNTNLCNLYIVKYLMQERIENKKEYSIFTSNNNFIFGAISYYNINNNNIVGYICFNNNIKQNEKNIFTNYFNINYNNKFICDKKKIDN